MKTSLEYMNGISGVYCAIHRASGMCYVGSSVNIGVRYWSHLGSAKRGSMVLFHRALREFGTDAFDFEILEECEKAELLNRERFYIALMGAASMNGFNVREKPAAVYGVTPTAATRERQRAAKLGKPLSEEHKERLRSAPRKCKKTLSPEHRAKLSLAHKTSPKCINHLQSLHVQRRGTKQPPELVEKRIAPLRGKKRDPEISAKIAAKNRGKKMSAQARANMSAGWVEWRRKRDKQILLRLDP